MAAKLQCEICGGKLIGKPGGIFECENCGTEYSTAWAKAKIQEITGTVKVEGTVEVTGKVQIDGPVKVEGGGPTADSLVKRGMQELEDKNWNKAESLFRRALEIDPENGNAFWGLYLQINKANSSDRMILLAEETVDLQDYPGYFRRAKQFANDELEKTIERVEKAWKENDQSKLLPPEMRGSHVIRKGILKRKKESEKSLAEAVLPEGVEIIEKRAFEGFKALQKVVFPQSLREIGYNAFEGCGFLAEISVPEGVTVIRSEAFKDCVSLIKADLPGTLEAIEPRTFQHCIALQEVNIQNGVNRICEQAFLNCESLDTIILPASVNELGFDAFRGCSSLIEVSILSPDILIKPSAFPHPSAPGFFLSACKHSSTAKFARDNMISFWPILTEEEAAEQARLEKEAEEKERLAREKAEKEERNARLKHLSVLQEKRKSAKEKNRLISAGEAHSIALCSDGKAIAVGDNYSGRCNVSELNTRPLIAVAAGTNASFAITNDGHVAATILEGVRTTDHGETRVSSWENIVEIACAAFHTVGLQADGRIISTLVLDKRHDYGQSSSVRAWNDITTVSANWFHTLGLKSDGTVLSAGDNSTGRCDVSTWRGIVAVAAGGDRSFGLKEDGTVVMTEFRGESKDFFRGQEEIIKKWTDIVAISAGFTHLLALRADGRVFAAGDNSAGQCDVGAWGDMVGISAGRYHSLGIRQNGIVYSTISIGQITKQAPVGGCWKLWKSPEEIKKERYQKRAELADEQLRLLKELHALKGLFSSSKKSKIEARLAEIEEELKKLG